MVVTGEETKNAVVAPAIRVDTTAPAPVVFPLRTEAPPERPDGWRRFTRDLIRGLMVLVVLQLFIVQVSVVRGHSMSPSLADGDRLLVDRVSHQLMGIDRFDVVVLRYPRDPSVDFVKRVVALPGERVRLDHTGLYVNGVRLDEPFQHVIDPGVVDERIVPEGHYYVLGDNRPISCDSREFGMVEGELVRGTVRARFWPISRASAF